LSLRIFPDRSERPRVGAWIFVLAWFIGNLALIAGFEAAQGLLQEVVVLGVLAVGCGAWWGAYRMSDYQSRGGFVVLILWVLSFIVPLLDLHVYVRNAFFWGAAAMIALLSLASGLLRARLREHIPSRTDSA
jgi:hypothetical protein